MNKNFLCRCSAGRRGVAGDQEGTGFGWGQAHQPWRRGPSLHLQHLGRRGGRRRPEAERHPGAAEERRNGQRGAHVQRGAGSLSFCCCQAWNFTLHNLYSLRTRNLKLDFAASALQIKTRHKQQKLLDKTWGNYISKTSKYENYKVTAFRSQLKWLQDVLCYLRHAFFPILSCRRQRQRGKDTCSQRGPNPGTRMRRYTPQRYRTQIIITFIYIF